MKHYFTLVCIAFGTAFFIFSGDLNAQIVQPGTPPSFSNSEIRNSVEVLEMPAVHVAALLKEDILEEQQGLPPRFGFPHKVSIDPVHNGTFDFLSDGSRVWRVQLHVPGALSVNLIFKEFHLPDGAELYLYNADRSVVLGAFTSANNKPWDEFATLPVKGENLIIEYYEPAAVVGRGRLKIGTVVHAYKDIFKTARGFGDSGSCNNDVNCPVGANWQDDKRSVVLTIVGGFRHCSGAMLNNVLQDGTPFFLTANHCLSGNPNGWVFIFNYESPGCNGGDGSIADAVSGAVLRATDSPSDFALMELSTPPPAGYNVYFAGWDRDTIPPDSCVGIHHPAGDVKKITFDYGTSFSSAGLSAGSPDTHWEIANWEDGTTEGGSSGSPLFDKNHRIVGQLHGGTASCSSLTEDAYGKFAYSWATGTTAATRLQNWLDPNNTGTVSVNGTYLGSPDSLDARIVSTDQPLGAVCDTLILPEITLRNNGILNLTSATIFYVIDGGSPVSFNWTGNLSYYQSVSVSLPSVIVPVGNHNLVVYSSAPNGGQDQNSANDTVNSSFSNLLGNELILDLTTDDYASETSWEIFDINGNLVVSGSGYSDNTTIQERICLGQGCFNFVIYDSFGDGICCNWGNGSYQLSTAGGIVHTGGQFASSETTLVCFSSVAPVAAFSASSVQVCAGETITYSDQSQNGPNGLNWSFQGGSPTSATTANPAVSYNQAGSYTTTQIASNNIGSDTTSITVTVLASPSVVVTTTDEIPGGSLGTATTSVSGGTQPFTYLWNTGGTSANLTGLVAGTYSVTVTDSNGCSAQGNGIVDLGTALDPSEDGSVLKVYPNPAGSEVRIEWDGMVATELQVILLNALGQPVESFSRLSSSNDELKLNLSEVPGGIYLLQLRTKGKAAIHKLVIRH